MPAHVTPVRRATQGAGLTGLLLVEFQKWLVNRKERWPPFLLIVFQMYVST